MGVKTCYSVTDPLGHRNHSWAPSVDRQLADLQKRVEVLEKRVRPTNPGTVTETVAARLERLEQTPINRTPPKLAAQRTIQAFEKKLAETVEEVRKLVRYLGDIPDAEAAFRDLLAAIERYNSGRYGKPGLNSLSHLSTAIDTISHTYSRYLPAS